MDVTSETEVVEVGVQYIVPAINEYDIDLRLIQEKDGMSYFPPFFTIIDDTDVS